MSFSVPGHVCALPHGRRRTAFSSFTLLLPSLLFLCHSGVLLAGSNGKHDLYCVKQLGTYSFMYFVVSNPEVGFFYRAE